MSIHASNIEPVQLAGKSQSTEKGDGSHTAAEVRITVSPPNAVDGKELEKEKDIKVVAESKPSKVEKPDNQEPISIPCQRLEQAFESCWIWLLSFALLVSLFLSVAALTGDDASWLKSSQQNDESRVGWRLACAERKMHNPNVSYSSTMQTYTLVACGPEDSVSSIETVLNKTSGNLGYAIFSVILFTWLCPIVIVVCSNYIRRTQGTCCHGFSVSGVWFLCGIALFALTVSFKYAVNKHLESHFEVRYSVTCSNFDRDISLCSNVRTLDACASKCRVNNEGRIVCAAYKACQLDTRKTTCAEDGIGCALDPSWAYYCSIGSAICLLLMALILTFGSLSVSKDL